MVISKDALISELIEIDRQLRIKSVPIQMRPIEATAEFAKRHNIALPLTEPIPGTYHEVYVNWPVTKFIMKWFDEQYGSRLGVDWGPGKAAFSLRGDPWHFHFSLFYGKTEFIVSREKSSKEFSQNAGVGVYNILDAVRNFPDGLKQSLTDDELKYIFDIYLLSYNALSRLEYCKGAKLVGLAKSDIEAAVNHIMDSEPEHGLSKWASLQATEKILKAVIEKKGGSFGKTHDLDSLTKQLLTVGVQLKISSEIKSIRCSPGMRYGEEQADLHAAVSAHHATFSVITKLENHL